MTEERLKEIELWISEAPVGGWMPEHTVLELISEIRRLKDAEEKAFKGGYSTGVRDRSIGAYRSDHEAWKQYKERA